MGLTPHSRLPSSTTICFPMSTEKAGPRRLAGAHATGQQGKLASPRDEECLHQPGLWAPLQLRYQKLQSPGTQHPCPKHTIISSVLSVSHPGGISVPTPGAHRWRETCPCHTDRKGQVRPLPTAMGTVGYALDFSLCSSSLRGH